MESRSLTMERSVKQRVDQAVQRRLANCSYAFVFCRVHWHFEDGQLTLTGRVPSFYLKQVLQELLRDLEDVERITNNVDVMSSNGLSSVRGAG